MIEELPNGVYLKIVNAGTMTIADASTMTEYDWGDQQQRVLNKNHAVSKRSPNGLLEPFQVTWKELTYRASRSFGRFTDRKVILNNISGSFKSGHFTAILGPSGCGKSSLLGCIAGIKRTGLEGQITISPGRMVKFAFIAQDDYLLQRLNIRESLMYASKLKNGSKVDHEMVVDTVLEKLRITECANIRPSRCSGGQRKRVSIAMELVSRPNILICDEPTSGLDSVTTKQLIQTLLELTQQNEPVAVVATIHQPSGVIFNMFHSIYILSYDGQCIYHGSPKDLLPKIEKYGLKCPEFHNPADFIIEVASKDHGFSKVMMLATVNRIDAIDNVSRLKEKPIQIIHKYDTLSHIWTLSLRNFKMAVRDPFILPIRVLGHLNTAILVGILYTNNVGKASGCPEDLVGGEGSYAEKYHRENTAVNENLSAILVFSVFGWFGSVFPYLLTFPIECNVFFKEYQNGWYSCFSYFMAKVISDIPFQLTIPNLFSVIAYIATGQIDEEWRLISIAIIVMMVALCSSSQGLMVSAIFMKYPSAAAFLGCCTYFPLMLFSGFMKDIDSMPNYFQWISYGDQLRFGLEASISAIYGFDRCNQNFNVSSLNKSPDWSKIVPDPLVPKFLPQKNFTRGSMINVLGFLGGGTNETQPIAYVNYGLDDDNLWIGIIMLAVLVVANRVLTYFILLWKVQREM